MPEVHILVHEGGRAISAAKVKDRNILKLVAEKAIHEAFDRAKQVQAASPLVGRYQLGEAERLKKMLTALIPEIERKADENEN